MTDTSTLTDPNATQSASAAPSTKTPIQSMTITGALVALVSGLAPVILGQLGFSSDQAAQVVNGIGALGTVIGAVMAIIGRMRATTKIV